MVHASFETPVLPVWPNAGFSTAFPVSGWTCSTIMPGDGEQCVVWNPDVTQVGPSGAFHGENVAAVSAGRTGANPTTVRQVLTSTMVYSNTYRLSVQVGRRIDGQPIPSPAPAYRIELWNNSAGSLLCSSSLPVTVLNTYVNPTCQYLASLGDNGDALEIRLIALYGPR